MTKPTFNKSRIERVVQEVFSGSSIKNFKKFERGLVSPTYEVTISKPNKKLAIKLSKIKNESNILKNNKILNYLHKNKIPSPEVFLCKKFDKKIITIMDFLEGNTAMKTYEESKAEVKKRIMINSAKVLKKIHSLKIKDFWAHRRHEVKNKAEWKRWTKLRIEKYLNFLEERFPKHLEFFRNDLYNFYDVLKKEKIDFVPLHWDYHLANVNTNKNGEIMGVFDFDNAMKGHSLSDIGQFLYWLRFTTEKYDNFAYFLKSYKGKFTKKELQMIRGYYLLHIVSVNRTIWKKRRRLSWIYEKHEDMIEEAKKGKLDKYFKVFSSSPNS